MGESEVQATERELARRLEEAGIPFVIAGAMALNAHGYRRATTDVDILLTAEGLATFQEAWLGRGYVEKFPGSRGLRDAVHGVAIDVLIAGGFPGDGEPKPVAFPDPAELQPFMAGGLPYAPLTTLVELKLASGMTARHRLKDLADVQELIKASALPRELADALDPWVREAYLDLWEGAQEGLDEDY